MRAKQDRKCQMKYDGCELMLDQLYQGTASILKLGEGSISGELAWNRYGVRDPSFLMDMEGNPVTDADGSLSLFFNARDNPILDGGITCVGVAKGNLGADWVIQPTPVFESGSYAAQGSVLQLAPDHFRMYYSPDTLRGFALASSVDGQNWESSRGQLILEPSAFGIRRMGLPFVRRVNNKWVMLFEGIHEGRFKIYMALSADGVSWEPSNQGRPIYDPSSSTWDAFGQANPSLCVQEHPDGETNYYILYNGCSAPHAWDIGILRAHSLQGPWETSSSPILCRGALNEDDAGRVEGARLLGIPSCQPRIIYFGLPTKDSYYGGQIRTASINFAENAIHAQKQSLAENSDAERSFNNRLADKYFNIWDNFPIQRFTNEVESQLMADLIHDSSKVLLLGSGGARELPQLLKMDCKVTAVDISPEMLAIGKARYPHASNVDWVEANLHELPANLMGFDFAICLGAVFNYLRDPTLVLRNIRRALKPDGSLVMSVINSSHPTELKKTSYLPDGRVRKLYNLGELIELIELSSFEFVSSRGMRFFVDMLPKELNSGTSVNEREISLLRNLLELEPTLSELMPSEKGKYITIHVKNTMEK